MSIDCPYLNGEICEIASKLAGQDAKTNIRACSTCINGPKPRDENNVTASLAVTSWNGNNIKKNEILKKVKQISLIGQPEQKGPGTELKRILSHLKIFPTNQCGCEETVILMNQQGSAWCRDNVPQLIERIEKSAKELGWKWLYSPVAVHGMIVIACDLADGLNWFTALLRLPKELIK